MSTVNNPITIFASAGSRFTMDRLFSGLDKVVNKHPAIRVKAQTGNSSYQSSVLEVIRHLSADKFEDAVRECDIFVSHAGMGNVLLAAQLNKPLIIMPRRVSLGEHINDHQIDTAQAFSYRPGVTIVNNTQELESAILSAMNFSRADNTQELRINDPRKELISTLKAFIDND